MNHDLLSQIDFAELYRRQARASSYGPRHRADWDKRAARRSRRESSADYARGFLRRLNLAGAASVLDIGCGTGNLAIPLAKKGLSVHAIDFSPKMLTFLRENAREAGVRGIRTHLLDWRDDWKSVPRCDIAICSRAMRMDDMQPALEKMSRMSRQRCYVTLHGGGHFLGDDVQAVLDRRNAVPRPGYIYAVNILHQMGHRVSVDYLKTTGGIVYADAEDFLAAIRWRVETLTPAEEKRLRHFFDTLPRRADGRTPYRHDFIWAFLSWEVTPARNRPKGARP